MGTPSNSVVQARGQITIPADIRRRWDLKQGSRVSFRETEEGILLIPHQAVATGALNAIGEALREKGISIEDLIESSREIRTELMEDMYGLTET